ncbi:MAG: hypothetical protein WCO96_05175 [Actinomycetes bacterium]
MSSNATAHSKFKIILKSGTVLHAERVEGDRAGYKIGGVWLKVGRGERFTLRPSPMEWINRSQIRDVRRESMMISGELVEEVTA